MPVPPAIARHQFSSVSPSRRSYGPSKLNIPSSLAPLVGSGVEPSMVVGAILYDAEQAPFVYCVSGKPSSGCSNVSAVILACIWHPSRTSATALMNVSWGWFLSIYPSLSVFVCAKLFGGQGFCIISGCLHLTFQWVLSANGDNSLLRSTKNQLEKTRKRGGM